MVLNLVPETAPKKPFWDEQPFSEMLIIHHFHTFPCTFWVIYLENTELFQGRTSYRVLCLMLGKYISESGNAIFCFSRITSLKLKFRLPSDRNLNFFFVFSKYKVEERFPIIFLRNHAILLAIFGSQIRFDSQFQLWEQLKKVTFFFVNLV